MSEFSFQVTDVELCKSDVQTLPAHEVIKNKFLKPDKQLLVRNACSHDASHRLVPRGLTDHGLVNAAALAFKDHRALRLRPQHFWLAITQGVARHVEVNAEILRDKFVRHEGKKELAICVDDEAARGFQKEDWEGIASRFVDQIQSNTVPGVTELLGADDFTGTTRAEQIAAYMTIMDCTKQFFDFKCFTCCGFPKITLEGSEADWQLLRTKAERLIVEKCTEEFSAWWASALLPTLDELAAARAGRVNKLFWEGMVKQGGTHGSGARTWVSGWINNFVPLLQDAERNPFTRVYVDDDTTKRNGTDIGDFPAGMSSAPVDLDHAPLEMRAGFLGAEVNEHGEVAPCVGWFVASGAVPASRDASRPWAGRAFDEQALSEILTKCATKVTFDDSAAASA
mmetsp:Transcript_73038/g.171688  ORF Transcript_73038/g.171688 Transcript_73038/m.171688 type:complete len:397 (-) Transcript_73038:73-1263(-)